MDFAASSTLLIIPDAHKFGSMEPHWCWLDDSIQWIEYGKQHPNYSVATITSAQVEKAFQADQEGTLRFRVHSQQYEINFKDMVQRNLRTQMTRQICWWPNDTSSGDRSQQKESMEKCWYCLDESNQWNEYGEESPNHCAATVTSARVEKAFQADQKGTLRFQTGYQQHEIDKLQRHGPEKSAHTDDKTNLLVAKRCLWWRRDPAERKVACAGGAASREGSRSQLAPWPLGMFVSIKSQAGTRTISQEKSDRVEECHSGG
ncbi:uncharacterized protein LOC112974663 [Apteryx rowi]|uniref:uncharacterized protein LOC112974663 n=1 Tax=Apteryx rowi TaxID=308060 RepID=UPI000E1C5512|nr:uncharacterized protein LOC112974663 [Apteryx rowi]